MPSPEEITRHTDVDPDGVEILAATASGGPVVVADPDPSWPAQFEDLAGRIRAALGPAVLELEHVGSTSVPDLPAKPVVDIDLTVVDAADEDAYVPALIAAGFALQLREPGWHEHRLLVSPAPRANVHVWSPGSPEAIRHRIFRDWLRDHPGDRRRYADVKRAAADATNASGEDVMAYNMRKQPLMREILDRAFRAHGLT